MILKTHGRTGPVLQATAGLIAGGIGAQLLMPLLRQVDPHGLSPVALISCAGGAALGWYVRGRTVGRVGVKEA